MDMSMIDLTDLPGVRQGLNGIFPAARQRWMTWRAILNTIPYELTCGEQAGAAGVYRRR